MARHACPAVHVFANALQSGRLVEVGRADAFADNVPILACKNKKFLCQSHPNYKSQVQMQLNYSLVNLIKLHQPINYLYPLSNYHFKKIIINVVPDENMGIFN